MNLDRSIFLLKLSSIYLTLSLLISFANCQAELNDATKAQILFLIQNNHIKESVELYLDKSRALPSHDFKVINEMAIAILDLGSRQKDPEIAVLNLLGCKIAENIDTKRFIKNALKSRYPQVQALALNCLAQLGETSADQEIIKMLGSPYFEVRVEAAANLALKNHPSIMSQLESLIEKTDDEFKSIYPPLLVNMSDARSKTLLQKLLNDKNSNVRVAAILSLASNGRDDFIGTITKLASQFDYKQQEACAYALGIFAQRDSVAILNKLAQSQYSSVSLAALKSLYQLGEPTALEKIKIAAQNLNLFAINILADLNEGIDTLLKLSSHPNIQVKFNAKLGLLSTGNIDSIAGLDYFLIKNKKDFGYTLSKSPAQTLKAYKVTSGASEIFKNNSTAYQENIELKEQILEKVAGLSVEKFAILAKQIYISNAVEMVPATTKILEIIESSEAIKILEENQQKLGAPLIRCFCSKALYNLDEPTAISLQLKNWIKHQEVGKIIHFRAFDPWQPPIGSYDLTPVESSRLLLETLQVFASKHDKEGIELILDLIANGNEKNRFALAGVLTRAAQ